MKTDMNMFLLNIEHFLGDIRGSGYLPIKKVYFFVGHPVQNIRQKNTTRRRTENTSKHNTQHNKTKHNETQNTTKHKMQQNTKQKKTQKTKKIT